MTHLVGPNTPIRIPMSSSSFGTSLSLDNTRGREGTQTRKIRMRSDPSVARTGVMHGVQGANKKVKVQLDDFQLIRVLGTGCAGRVLLVQHTPTNAIRAMKAISKRSVLTYHELSHTLTELAILKRFAIEEPDNAFIARLHHSFTDRENFYFVMDFYPGGDLATQMEIHRILGHHRMRFYAADTVQGLEHLHRHGIIMRDMKPENILLNTSGHAVLVDFGLAKGFGYRGDPKRLHVVNYPGQPPVPEWAGAGAGSTRVQANGSRKLVVDRAYSFVGTSEYLSPEVVQRGEYSYAVDWWALGCIVLEGLIGRVPFRIDDDEPPVVLWNKILLDPWDDVLKEPQIARRPLLDYGLDATTWHFIDSLLIKDPMWRLTEPFVKKHEYFAMIDWETVRQGGYEDPHGLELHPMAEYNTRYFPKLCLEEEPSVDMTAHRPRLSEGQTSTPLNDNQLFALEQAKFRAELEAFTWSRDEGETGESASEVDLSVDLESHESISGCSSAKERNGVALGPNELERVVELPVNEATPRVANPEWLQEEGGKTSRAPAEFSETSGPQAGSDESATPADSSSSTSVAPQGDASPTEHIASSPDSIRNASHGGIVDRGGASSTVTIPFVSGSSYDNGTVHDLVLPTSYPASGLSVSDVVSVPSNSVGSPHRLFRRHLHLPNAETAPMARLSVELNGTITILDDEEWEELSSEGIGSLPNGPTPRSGPSTFLTRGFGEILRRQPSTLVTTGLRRQPKTSDSSRESSPTKFRPLLNPGSFASRSVEGTKKALGRLKTFPKLRKAGEGGEGEIAPVAAKSPTGNVESTAGSAIKPRPSDTHRHTESGTDGFDKRPRLPKHGLTSTPRVCKQSGSSSNPSTGEGPVPRVELTSTPPVVW